MSPRFKFVGVLTLLLIGTSCSQQVRPPGTIAEVYEGIVLMLGDPSVTLDEKYKARTALKQGGPDVIPILIAHLSDPRVFDPEMEVANGSADPPESYSESVGITCRRLLGIIVFENPRKVPYKMDWGQWWEAAKTRPWEQVIAEARGAK